MKEESLHQPIEINQKIKLNISNMTDDQRPKEEKLL
jgi:hypothetical protein